MLSAGGPTAHQPGQPSTCQCPVCPVPRAHVPLVWFPRPFVQTALMIAATLGADEVRELLLRRGTDVNQRAQDRG